MTAPEIHGTSIPDEAERRAGLRALVVVTLTLLASAAVPYVLPGLERERPWIAGEPVPVLHLYGIGAGEEEAPAEGPSEAAIAEALAAPVVRHAPPPPAAEGEVATVRIEPSELEGLVREIEDPSGHAMDAFYAQLLRTARGEDEAVTRIAHFGDSTIALDGITMTVRESMQLRFGDAGHGFVLAARRPLPYRHFQVRHDDAGSWSLYDLTHLRLSDGRYGLGGVQVRSTSGASAYFETDRPTGARRGEEEPSSVGGSVSSFQIFYQRHPRGGNVQTRIDDGAWETLDTSGELEDAVHRIEVPDGPHRLSIRTAGRGNSRLYGVVLERSGPGVVYDSLGIVGARASRMLGFDPAHLRTQLAQRETNLVVVAFGGNDADDLRSEDEFFRIFSDVARLVREARPEASCLLFAPLDQAVRDERGRVVTMPSVPRIVSAARRAAEAEGCAFFDTWTAMGGEGAMGRWYRHSPRLSSSDFRHATPAGYRVIGNLFYRALLAGFRDRLERGGDAAPGEVAAGTTEEASE